MTYEQLLAEFEALAEKCAENDFHLVGAILTPEEFLVSNMVNAHDDLFGKMCETVDYACEDEGLSPDDLYPTVFVKRQP